MEYKGYQGTVSYDDEAKIFHGEVIGFKDVITFQATSEEDLEQVFKDSIDEFEADLEQAFADRLNDYVDFVKNEKKHFNHRDRRGC